MRKIDVILIGVAVAMSGLVFYWLFQAIGIDSAKAGIWSQAVLIVGLLGWIFTYIFRVLTKNMTYNQQLKNYEDAMIKKRFEQLSPEELAQLQAEIEQEEKISDG
jgi:Protein of unknown function (DUF3007)